MMKCRRYIFILVLLCLCPYLGYSQIHLTEINLKYDGPEEFRNNLDTTLQFAREKQTSRENLVSELDRLGQSGIFSVFEYDLIPKGADNYLLDLTIVKPKQIRNLDVSGNYPFLSKNITKLIPLQPGSGFNKDLIQDSIDAIDSYLEKYGFYKSQITIDVEEVQEHDVVDLHIRLKRGRTYHIDNIYIEGNENISDKRIRNKISQGSRFRMKRFKKNLKSIQSLYAKKGFIKTRVKAQRLEFNDNTGKVDIYLTIRENKHFKLVIKGNTYFDKQYVKAVTRLKESRAYDRYAIRRAKKRLERYYELRGFPDALIETEIIKPDKKSVIAQFTITPGTRVELQRIKFIGNKNISDKKLKKAMDSKESSLMERAYFSEDRLKKDRDLLADVYHRNGFFNVQISSPDIYVNDFGDQKRATYTITEREEYYISKIEFSSEDLLDKEALLKKSELKTGKKFRADKIDKAQTKIYNEILNQGYAYAQMSADKRVHPDGVDIQFNIEKGPKVHIRSIIVDGNLITREKTIRNNLKIKAGDTFVYDKMLDGQLNLRRLASFSSVRITPLGFEEKSSEIDLVVSVTERKTVSMNIQGGFDSRHLVTGEFNFTKYNLFGTGRQLNGRFIGGPKYDRMEMTFFSPRVFGASWNLSIQGFGQYEDEVFFTAFSYGAFASTLKNFGAHWTFGFKEQVAQTEVFESKSDVAQLGDSLFDNTFNEFQMSLLLDYRDNFSDPQRGFYVLAQNELNTDLQSVSNNFNTFKFNINHYYGFLRRFTFVNTFRYWHTFDISSNPRIPVNKLFFMGGSDTVRGFPEDSIDPSGGTIMMIYNGELQYRITDAVKVAAFFDAGVIGDDVNMLTRSDIRESAGVGLRYFTPIGPIRLDWGFILDRQPGEPKQRIHFSFGYFF
ncbi:MAG: outer membrane protein assembly factor BamA [bacterium]|nr:outer membrane protein assembly factor BamA [bacterium]MBU1916787.1 outer membrane protein assembly factor BamA [bacterium]